MSEGLRQYLETLQQDLANVAASLLLAPVAWSCALGLGIPALGLGRVTGWKGFQPDTWKLSKKGKKLHRCLQTFLLQVSTLPQVVPPEASGASVLRVQGCL